MAVYSTFDSLNGKTLKEGDVVILSGIQYTTYLYHGFLNCTDLHSNSLIFDKLSIQEKNAMASAAYGYDTRRGDRSEAYAHDGEALTRLALVLLGFSEGFDVEVKMPSRRWKLFSIKKWCVGISTVNIDRHYYQVTDNGDVLEMPRHERMPFRRLKKLYEEADRIRKENASF